jgi:hypothetical protein
MNEEETPIEESGPVVDETAPSTESLNAFFNENPGFQGLDHEMYTDRIIDILDEQGELLAEVRDFVIANDATTILASPRSAFNAISQTMVFLGLMAAFCLVS